MGCTSPLAQKQAAKLLPKQQFCNIVTLCWGTSNTTCTVATVTPAFHFALTREAHYLQKLYVGLEPCLLATPYVKL